MKIGIIGTGTIAFAIVTGFCIKDSGHEFFLSPRNAEKAAKLAKTFPEKVQVCESNQDVLDKADWIFITVQKSGFEALKELNFRPDHKVLNMATEMKLPFLKEIAGETEVFAHVVPLPMIVQGFGPLLVYPEVLEVGELFKDVADAVYLKNLDDTRTLQLLTCVMSAYYMLLEEIVDFSDGQGVDHELSIKFTHYLLSALTRRAVETKDCDLVELAHDMTPGGYNEQAMKELMDNGAIPAWGKALENLRERLMGHTKD
jgi:pyrroline-5-carboxylate reductase